MTYKLRHITVLFLALGLGAAVMYVEMNPWFRVAAAGFLLVPIMYGAEGLGIPKLLQALPGDTIRHRQFGVLRSQVVQLLDLVRRLNWLNVDLERGVRKEDDVKGEIALAEQRLDEILTEIRSVAGRSSQDTDVGGESGDFSHQLSAQEQP